jgi:stage II sporulation protein P
MSITEYILNMPIIDIIETMYNVDPTAALFADDIDPFRFMSMDFSLSGSLDDPKILIFHTHSQEAFIDSRHGEADDTIVGMGRLLAQILNDEYNVGVVHYTGVYDVVDGVHIVAGSYERMENSIIEILAAYPTIEVCIDLHRDGLPENVHLVTEIDGRQTARIMFFNGILRLNNELVPINLYNDFPNPYLDDNLAFSFNMQMKAMELYPNFARRIYIRPYRYSLHFKPKSLLIELGANTNTVEEARNAVAPLAEVLAEVLGLK